MMRHIVPQAADREYPGVRRAGASCFGAGIAERRKAISFSARSLRASSRLWDTGQLGRFEALPGCTDPDLFDWIFGVSDPPPEHDHDVMQLLRGFCTERRLTPLQYGQHRS